MADPVAFFRSLHRGATCGVIGAPRTGKSRAVQAADKAGVFRRRVVYDPMARVDRRAWRAGKRDCTPWQGDLVSVTDILRNPKLLDRDPLRLVVCPERDLRPSEHGPEFELLADLVWNTGDLDLIAEECGQYSRAASEMVLKLSSGGGHVGVRLILTCQSLGRISVDGRRHLSHVLSFAQAEENDIRALRTRCGRQFADAVQRLPMGAQPLTWRLGANLEKRQ